MDSPILYDDTIIYEVEVWGGAVGAKSAFGVFAERRTAAHGVSIRRRQRRPDQPRAACLIPSRIRTYVPQRHRFPAIAASMAASSGCGLAASKADADMICPGWH